MFSTKGQEVKQGSSNSKSLEPGVALAHIYSANVRTASTGKKCLELVLEGPAVDGFEGWAVDRNDQDGVKFRGPSAKVGATIYTADFESDDVNKNDILRKIITIADEAGVRSEIDGLSGSGSITTIEEWVAAATNILKNHSLYFFLVGTEKEYNGKTIVVLSLPKFKFCAADPSKLNKFDKNNKYHYVALVNKPLSGFEPASDDFGGL
jgi:hypothetical protein